MKYLSNINYVYIFLLLSFFSCQKEDVNDDGENNKDENNEIITEDGYKLIWEEEFEGTELNKDVWNIEVNGNGGGNRELQYYREENVTLGKEPKSGKQCLIITAKKENFENKTATSGRINSMGKKYFKYGRLEASIKLPETADGLWPAFWMMGNDYDEVGWPSCGEIDILEMGHSTGINNNTQDRYFNGACHWGFYKNGQYPNYSQHSTSDYSLQDDFHLFTMYWSEDKIQMYLDIDKYPDAEPYFEMLINGIGTDWDTSNYFRKEFFFLINLAVGGKFPNIFNINDVTALESGEAKMYVDYIKVYEKVEAESETENE